MKISTLSIFMILFPFLWSCNALKQSNLPITTNNNPVNIRYDTVLTKVIDTTISLSPTRDLGLSPCKMVSLDLPLKSESFRYGSYWVGVGLETLIRYESLEQTTPRAWSKPGVSVPLGAFSLGEPVLLPESPAVNSNKVNVYLAPNQYASRICSNSTDAKRFETESFKRKIDLPERVDEKWYLIIKNNSPITTYKVDVKVIATQIKPLKDY